jgi:hypothetical protein
LKTLTPNVSFHYFMVANEAEAQAVTTDAIIKKVFNAVPVP